MSKISFKGVIGKPANDKKKLSKVTPVLFVVDFGYILQQFLACPKWLSMNKNNWTKKKTGWQILYEIDLKDMLKVIHLLLFLLLLFSYSSVLMSHVILQRGLSFREDMEWSCIALGVTPRIIIYRRPSQLSETINALTVNACNQCMGGTVQSDSEARTWIYFTPIWTQIWTQNLNSWESWMLLPDELKQDLLQTRTFATKKPEGQFNI